MSEVKEVTISTTEWSTEEWLDAKLSAGRNLLSKAVEMEHSLIDFYCALSDHLIDKEIEVSKAHEIGDLVRRLSNGSKEFNIALASYNYIADSPPKGQIKDAQ